MGKGSAINHEMQKLNGKGHGKIDGCPGLGTVQMKHWKRWERMEMGFCGSWWMKEMEAFQSIIEPQRWKFPLGHLASTALSISCTGKGKGEAEWKCGREEKC